MNLSGLLTDEIFAEESKKIRVTAAPMFQKCNSMNDENMKRK